MNTIFLFLTFLFVLSSCEREVLILNYKEHNSVFSSIDNDKLLVRAILNKVPKEIKFCIGRTSLDCSLSKPMRVVPSQTNPQEIRFLAPYINTKDAKLNFIFNLKEQWFRTSYNPKHDPTFLAIPQINKKFASAKEMQQMVLKKDFKNLNLKLLKPGTINYYIDYPLLFLHLSPEDDKLPKEDLVLSFLEEYTEKKLKRNFYIVKLNKSSEEFIINNNKVNLTGWGKLLLSKVFSLNPVLDYNLKKNKVFTIKKINFLQSQINSFTNQGKK